ncbi:MAG: acyl-CoA dehydrogenase family protein [Rhodospirillales bacterium]|nr:acyl-CoA dehydrogenase family protein [Rhodospirillales bacterium]
MPGREDVFAEFNQAPPLVGYDAFSADRALVEAVERHGASWAKPQLGEVGRLVGSERVQTLARQANRFTPELRTHDRYGRRIDLIEFHPAWHELMGLVWGSGTHALGWTAARPGAQTARAALCYLWNQGENGIMCPVAMTFAGVPVIRREPAVAAAWEAKILSTEYDPRPLPAEAKKSAIVAMALTEKQGGSDLRAISTRAERAEDGRWRLFGHKWFFSVPHADLFLCLARTEAGVSCFAVAGWLPDGTRNGIRLQRLKDKLGNRSNASSEVEFDGAVADLVGEEGRGIATVIQMAHLTRLDCAVSSAAMMRQALSQAIHHCRHRSAFQRRLVDQPAMRAVLADLALETEAATALAFRVAAALDGESDEAERLLNRIAAPIAKYWNCKRAPGAIVEAMECHGGNGYVEELNLARLYRDAPVNAIWEGSGNVICLDVLRALEKSPASAEAFLAELRRAKGADRRLDALAESLAHDLSRRPSEREARALVERMALALEASLLVRHAPPVVAEAFCASRLEARAGLYGCLPEGIDEAALIERATVAAA